MNKFVTCLNTGTCLFSYSYLNANENTNKNVNDHSSQYKQGYEVVPLDELTALCLVKELFLFCNQHQRHGHDKLHENGHTYQHHQRYVQAVPHIYVDDALHLLFITKATFKNPMNMVFLVA